MDGQAIEFYIEGTRSRSGKMLPPKTGMLSTVTSTFLDRKVPNINIIPLAINYERVSAFGLRCALLALRIRGINPTPSPKAPS